MKDFEEFLKKSIEEKNQFNSVNCISIDTDGRMIIDKLKDEGLIKNVRYMSMCTVGFNLIYDGLHYFEVKVVYCKNNK